MSDLPETEILRRQVQARFGGHRVVAAEAPDLDASVLVGGLLDDVTRHGRVLTLHFGPRQVALSMRRAARLTLSPPRPSARLGLALTFESGLCLYYTRGADRAGGDTPSRKGVEPLSSSFSLGNFKRILGKRTRNVKFALSDDELVAGLGTLYPDEILHLAGIRPDRAVADLTDDEKRDLYFAIFQILHKAIRFGGLSGNGYTLDGQAGGFERFVGVVRRDGERCSSCQGRVRRVEFDRRQAWFCPRCQH